MAEFIDQSVEVLGRFNAESSMEVIEMAARTCYRTEDKISAENDSATKIISKCIKRGHESVIEHEKITLRIISDRALINELERHRLCSFSQESTRYVNYNKKKIMKFIKPNNLEKWGEEAAGLFMYTCNSAELSYNSLIKAGMTPEIARGVLPLSLASTLVMTANLREWRHILNLRCSDAAHPDMQVLAKMILETLHALLPVIFQDLYDQYLAKDT